ncbi:hypothetical protein [Cupriavidus lacunae]|uniref:Uncharacterized protein n=1 Tax=Cupriavidus lacunae TaxID=2666307 RepID=A0A370P1H7_9BURK|nr:hypothetical protein [Cupriavidus lacunae]RDK11719.1 hypothetical protein DN412_02090 [Cupriavidus lacunae]
MMLYPAGPDWAQTFETALPTSTLAARLADAHGFTRSTLFQPFGAGRGTVIAQRDHLLVLAVHAADGQHWYEVTPSLEMQNLLWSFSYGYASQWSALELKALCGCTAWPDVIALARQQFAAAVRSLERALAGLPERDAPAAAPDLPFYDGEVIELPGDYLASMTGLEVSECGH